MALAGCIGPPLAEVFGALLPDAGEAVRARGVAAYRAHYGAHGWCQNRVYPGIPALLEAVSRRGWRAAIATSKTRDTAERIARHFGLRSHLAAVYGSEADGALGAKAELLAHALAREGAHPERAVMVGDRRHDVEGAHAVGIPALGVAWGYGSRRELREAGAARVCDTPDELARALSDLHASGPAHRVGIDPS